MGYRAFFNKVAKTGGERNVFDYRFVGWVGFTHLVHRKYYFFVVAHFMNFYFLQKYKSVRINIGFILNKLLLLLYALKKVQDI
jgi:hypothetical protein